MKKDSVKVHNLGAAEYLISLEIRLGKARFKIHSLEAQVRDLRCLLGYWKEKAIERTAPSERVFLNLKHLPYGVKENAAEEILTRLSEAPDETEIE